jgi:phage-related protein
MAAFPSIDPSYGVQQISAPDVRVVQFGDGYQQRLRFGEQNNPKTWSVAFENITTSDSDTITAFLDARGDDAASFDWTPPGASSSSKYVCFEWNKSINYANLATIQATFTEVFEP